MAHVLRLAAGLRSHVSATPGADYAHGLHTFRGFGNCITGYLKDIIQGNPAARETIHSPACEFAAFVQRHDQIGVLVHGADHARKASHTAFQHDTARLGTCRASTPAYVICHRSTFQDAAGLDYK